MLQGAARINQAKIALPPRKAARHGQDWRDASASRDQRLLPSRLSITQLEKSAGARLFERSTRSVVLTEAGQQLKGKASGVLAGFDDLPHSVQRDDCKLEGHIRVMAPTTLTMLRIGPVFNGFLDRHERITMEVALVPAQRTLDEAAFFLRCRKAQTERQIRPVPPLVQKKTSRRRPRLQSRCRT